MNKFIARSAIYVGGVFWRDVHLFVVCLFVVTDFSHFLQGYLHWGQAYAYWCFDQKVHNLKFFTKMNQFHQRVRGGNCGSRSQKWIPFGNLCFLRQSDVVTISGDSPPCSAECYLVLIYPVGLQEIPKFSLFSFFAFSFI